ncbi:hypothetical protein B0H19DRAFT_581826 [Mycena capillaripes]|nr:hypothetical protein B0H19DRAFT_581826 [Mycena capillaripes]
MRVLRWRACQARGRRPQQRERRIGRLRAPGMHVDADLEDVGDEEDGEVRKNVGGIWHFLKARAWPAAPEEDDYGDGAREADRTQVGCHRAQCRRRCLGATPHMSIRAFQSCISPRGGSAGTAPAAPAARMCALAARYAPQPDSRSTAPSQFVWLAGNTFLFRAKALLDSSYASSRASTCQAFLLMGFRYSGLGRLQSGGGYGTLALLWTNMSAYILAVPSSSLTATLRRREPEGEGKGGEGAAVGVACAWVQRVGGHAEKKKKDGCTGKAARGVALLEVRSLVRVVELYKIIVAVRVASRCSRCAVSCALWSSTRSSSPSCRATTRAAPHASTGASACYYFAIGPTPPALAIVFLPSLPSVPSLPTPSPPSPLQRATPLPFAARPVVALSMRPALPFTSLHPHLRVALAVIRTHDALRCPPV